MIGRAFFTRSAPTLATRLLESAPLRHPRPLCKIPKSCTVLHQAPPPSTSPHKPNPHKTNPLTQNCLRTAKTSRPSPRPAQPTDRRSDPHPGVRFFPPPPFVQNPLSVHSFAQRPPSPPAPAPCIIQ